MYIIFHRPQYQEVDIDLGVSDYHHLRNKERSPHFEYDQGHNCVEDCQIFLCLYEDILLF